MRRVCITGGAGFIGSNLADELIARDVEVVILDNFRTGRHDFLAGALGSPLLRLVQGDVSEETVLRDAVAGCDWVFHLQANADVRRGFEHPSRDLRQNTLATAGVLEAMRAEGVSRIVFSSTGSVYGEPEVVPTPEDAPFPVQTSLYAASKLAGEGLIEAYAAGYGFTGLICRLVSILGERYTHGHVFDFFTALQRDPTCLRVLGDGRQAKSYLHVGDCISAMLAAVEWHNDDPGAHIYNIGVEETIAVDDSVKLITGYLGLSPTIEHTGGRRGWTGDSPLILLDTTRIRGLGWRPKLTIAEGIERTLDWLQSDSVWRRETVRTTATVGGLHPTGDGGRPSDGSGTGPSAPASDESVR
jgi:UDP-glucose 4-epimerase